MRIKPLRNKLMLVNEAGEVIADEVLIFGKKPYVDKGFVKVFVAFLQDIVLDEEISGKAVRLLLYVIERMDYNSLTVYLYYKDVCKDLNISLRTFYNWLNALIRKGYLERVAPNLYRLRPYTAVKGYIDTEKELRKVVYNKSSNGEELEEGDNFDELEF